MSLKASCVVLPAMTIAASLFLIKTVPQSLSQAFYPAMPAVDSNLNWQPVAWEHESSDQDLLGIPLESLEFEMRQLSAQHGWSSTWYRLLLPQVVKQNCGVPLATLSLPRQVEAANLLGLSLAANLSPEVRASLGKDHKMQAIYERLTAQMQEMSVERQADLNKIAAQRLATMVSGERPFDATHQDSYALAMLHVALLYEVWQQSEQRPSLAPVAPTAACPTPLAVPADHLEHRHPTMLAAK